MSIDLSVSNFDLWVFHRSPNVEYLLLRTSEDKAKRFFGGGRFWQIPTDVVRSDETIEDPATRIMGTLGLVLSGLWAAEYTYTIYNRRRREIAVIPVFAAEVVPTESVTLTWEHSEYGWYPASDCMALLHYRGLKEGLASVAYQQTLAFQVAPHPLAHGMDEAFQLGLLGRLHPPEAQPGAFGLHTRRLGTACGWIADIAQAVAIKIRLVRVEDL